jgi:hypothetical protein
MRNQLRISHLALIVALVAGQAATLHAQGVSIDVRVDRTEVTIGDRVNLEVVVTADTVFNVVLPPTEEALGVFEVKDFRQFDPATDKAGRRVYRSQYNVTTWTTGRWVVPPLTVTFTDSAGHSGSASSDSVFIKVKSILAEAGADTVDIRDLKPPYSVPTRRAVYYYLAGAVILAALIAWWYLRRRRRKAEAVVGDMRTPWERAFDELNALRGSDLLPEEKWREWYFVLTEVFRRYVDARYGLETLEATTTEIKLILPRLPATDSEQQVIVEFLEFADLVKFARLAPPPSRPQDDFAWVWAFVERTKIEVLPQAQGAAITEKTGTTG